MATDSIGRVITPIIKLSKSDWDRICGRVRNGEGSVPEIARLEGLSNDRTLRRQCRKRGIDSITRAEEALVKLDEAKSLYETGMSLVDVSLELGLKVEGLKKALVDSGYRIRRSGEVLRLIPSGSETEARLIELYKTTSLEDLEVVFGINRSSLARTLKRNGVELRKRGQHIVKDYEV